jgi:hypothetical protein
MRVIAVPTTYPRAEIAEADYVVERLAELRIEFMNGRIELALSRKSNQ